MNTLSDEKVLFEHQFWLQILGDHARFIFYSLSPTETEYILTAQEFILLFDQLLEQSHGQLTAANLDEFSHRTYDAAYRLREFKIELLGMSIKSDLKSSLPTSFFNGMLNELEEYLSIINAVMNGQNPLEHPLHYHMLWLSDAAFHAATLTSTLDSIEKDLIGIANNFEIRFQDYYLKALHLKGYLRTGYDDFPSIERLNEQAKNNIVEFTEFLDNIRDQRMDQKVLGSLMPLMADHMSREECYYLWKLSETTDNIRRPECDPTRPRLET